MRRTFSEHYYYRQCLKLYAECINEGIFGNIAKGIGNAALNVGQMGLTTAGLIPGVGEVADLANAGVSLARGDPTGAALNAAAAIPGLGYAANVAKAGRFAGKAATGAGKAAAAPLKAADAAVDTAGNKIIGSVQNMAQKTMDAIPGIADKAQNVMDAIPGVADKVSATATDVKKIADKVKNNPKLAQIRDMLSKLNPKDREDFQAAMDSRAVGDDHTQTQQVTA